MQFKLRLLTAVAFLLVACGGGGSSNGPLSSTGDTPTSGIAVDGYLVGSTVSCDVDGTGFPSTANFTADALTDSGGSFTFSKGCPYRVIVTGGQDYDTKLFFKGVLWAPVGATVVSPVSTLIAALVATTGKSVADLQDLVNKSLGLDINTDLLNTDPAAIRTVTRTDANGKQTVTTLYNNLALYKANLTVQQLIQSITEIIVAKGNADTELNSYAATASALATTLANPLSSDTRPLNTEILTTFIANAVPNTSNVKIVADEISKLVQGIADTSKVTPDQITAEVVKVAESSTGKANALAQILQSDAKSLPEALKALTTTTTTTTTTTATTTTTTYAPLPPASPGNFLYLANDSVSFDDGLGASISSYTLTQFQTGAGIPVQWPLNNAAALKFTLADGGAFSVPSGQTYSAALSITDTDSTAQVRAYVDSITLSKTGTDITAFIPSSAAGRVYLKSVDGTEALCAWASCGGGKANTTMSTDPSQPSSIALGQIINKAVNTLSSFTPKSGKYAVTLVVSGLPMTKADRVTLLPTYAVSVPNGTANPVLVVGTGLQGYITVTNNNIPPTTTTSTTTTTTTASSTTSTLAPWLSYLTLANDTLNFNDGAASTAYTVGQFKTSPGIRVKWPMADAAAISFTLTETGTYAPLSTLPLTAALSLTDTSTGSAAKIKAYIDNVKVTRGADNSISITIPSSANALVYGLNRDGTQAVLVPVSNLVAGVNNTLGTGQNNIVLGSVVNNAVHNFGSSFTGVNALTGTYQFTLVVTDLPLRQANGTAFPVTTITVPTSLSGSSVRTVTGAGLTGFVTLAP